MVEAFEARARERADWISQHNKQLQLEEEKRQIEAAELKMKELEEKFDENDEFSDGSDLETEEATRQVSEQVDGLAEYQQNMALSLINYKDFMKTLKNLNAISNYS